MTIHLHATNVFESKLIIPLGGGSIAPVVNAASSVIDAAVKKRSVPCIPVPTRRKDQTKFVYEMVLKYMRIIEKIMRDYGVKSIHYHLITQVRGHCNHARVRGQVHPLPPHHAGEGPLQSCATTGSSPSTTISSRRWGATAIMRDYGVKSIHYHLITQVRGHCNHARLRGQVHPLPSHHTGKRPVQSCATMGSSPSTIISSHMWAASANMRGYGVKSIHYHLITRERGHCKHARPRCQVHSLPPHHTGKRPVQSCATMGSSLSAIFWSHRWGATANMRDYGAKSIHYHLITHARGHSNHVQLWRQVHPLPSHHTVERPLQSCATTGQVHPLSSHHTGEGPLQSCATMKTSPSTTISSHRGEATAIMCNYVSIPSTIISSHRWEATAIMRNYGVKSIHYHLITQVRGHCNHAQLRVQVHPLSSQHTGEGPLHGCATTGSSPSTIISSHRWGVTAIMRNNRVKSIHYHLITQVRDHCNHA